MANVQLAVAGDETTQVILSVPGVQGPAGSNLPPSGTTHQLLYKQSNTDYDTAWKLITNDNVDAAAEIAVSKLADGSARQLLQTDAAGTGVEWTSNVDIPGTLDVTSAATFDAAVTTTGLLSASGKISVPLASGEGPSIYFGADTDTGIYSPGANQVALSTNGTGRLFVDANGNIGVGQASPAVYFDIFKSGANQADLRVRNGTSGLNLAIKADGTADISNVLDYPITFTTGTTPSEKLRITSTGQLSHIGAGSAGSPAVSFNGSAPSNSLVIDSAGLVGIGTSAPSTMLHVSGSASLNTSAIAAAALSIGPDSGAGGTPVLAFTSANTSNQRIDFGDPQSSSIGRITYSHATNSLALRTNGADALTIDSSGRVGIGTTNPGQKLVLNEPGATGVYTQWINNSSSKIGYAGLNSSGNLSFETNSVIQFVTGSGYLERARIDSSGTFYVVGAGTGGVNYAASFSGSAPVNSLNLDSSGRLLVGTSTARSNVQGSLAPRLQVEGTDGSTSSFTLFRNQTNSAPILGLGASGGTTANSVDLISGAGLGTINFYGTDGVKPVRAASIEAATDGSTGLDDMPGRLVFSVTADDAASPTEALRISSNRAITVSDGGHIVLGTGTGTKIGTSTSQKIGFFDETPIVQPTTGIAEAAFVENSGGTAVNVDSTFGGYTIQQVVQALQNLGLLA